MDRRTDGHVYITLQTECFLSAVVELTEHTKGSLQSSDAFIRLQKLPSPSAAKTLIHMLKFEYSKSLDFNSA